MPSERAGRENRSEVTAVFGVRVAGTHLLLPSDQTLEYVADAASFPLPGAGHRVLGMMQLRGHPILVLDGGPRPAQRRPEIRRCAVLVIGTPPEAGAIVVDAPPEQVATGAPADAAAPPGSSFDSALHRPMCDARTPDRIWWHADVRQMFRILAGE